MSELKINPDSWRKVHQEVTGEDPYRWSTIIGVVIEDQFVPIAQFGVAWSQDWNTKQPQYEAIADLIVAAPDMYAALEKIMEIELAIAQEYPVGADDSTIYAIAENAIRKARGESEMDKKKPHELTCTCGEMTLDEAIKHCEDKIDDTPCGKEHLQLRNWLIELKHFKSEVKK